MKLYRLMMAAFVLGIFAPSCVNEQDDDSPVTTTTPTTISLTLKGDFSDPVTRTSSASLPTSTLSSEACVNSLVVGIFDKATGKVDQVLAPDMVTTTSTKSGTSTATISTTVTTTYKDPILVVVANVPRSIFNGITSLSEFQQRCADLKYTTGSYSPGKSSSQTSTSEDGTTTTVSTSSMGSYTQAESNIGGQVSTLLPMVGTISFSFPTSSGGYTGNGTVTLTRLVARVAVTKISASFSSTGGFSGYKFLLDQVFMYNVRNQNSFEISPATLSPALSGSFYQGETTNATNYIAYLGSGAIMDASKKQYDVALSAYTTPQYFYVFPNYLSSGNLSTYTKLVVKGTLVSSGGVSTVQYYPIRIDYQENGASLSGPATKGNGMIYSNTDYELSLKITGTGAKDPGDDRMPVSCSVNSWATGTLSATFN